MTSDDELLTHLDGIADMLEFQGLRANAETIEQAAARIRELLGEVIHWKHETSSANARIRELEAALRLIMVGGSHSEGMQWHEHDLSQVRTIAAAVFAGDFRATQPDAKRQQGE